MSNPNPTTNIMFPSTKVGTCRHLSSRPLAEGAEHGDSRHGQDLASIASFGIDEKMIKNAETIPVGEEEYIFLCEEELEELLLRKKEEKRNDKQEK